MLSRFLFSAVFAASVLSATALSAAPRCPLGSKGLAFLHEHGDRLSAAAAARRLLLKDRDDDGIPDCIERSLGFSPKKSDSNGNQISDADEEIVDGQSLGELFESGALDSDGDGFSDADEFRENPLNVYVVGKPFFRIIHAEAAAAAIVASAAEPSAELKKLCKKLKKKQAAATSARESQSLQIKISKKCKKKSPQSGNPTPKPTAAPGSTPTPRPTATPTPSSGGGSATRGRSFYTANCTQCHGVRAGKTASQIQAAMNTVPSHSIVKGLVNSQTLLDIAAYLANP